MTVTAEQYAKDCSKYVYDAAQDKLTLPNAVGRVLQGGEQVRSIEAGLPNITGTIHTAYRNISSGEPTGAVARGNTENGSNMGSLGEFWVTYTFDASRSNPIYGASKTVQPPAITMIAQIKY